ncbi:MAG: hypothetical protein AAGU14_02055 [Eubacteriaceae bacterium]
MSANSVKTTYKFFFTDVLFTIKKPRMSAAVPFSVIAKRYDGIFCIGVKVPKSNNIFLQ